MKLPWSRKRVESNPGLADAISALTTANDASQAETNGGSNILEKHQVETEELGALAKLPPFRPVAIRLLRLFDSHDVEIDDITKLVESDPSLTSELLAVVNSPLFAFHTTVASVAHAINLMGVQRMKSLTATLAMRSMVEGAPRTPIVRRFWVHSIATATIAQDFAPLFRLDPNLVYVGSLLHDLGRLGLLAAHPEEYSTLALAAYGTTEEILAAERAAFGMSHCEAGALLAKSWSLPEPFRQIARQHHAAPSNENLILLAQLSCRLADDLMYPAIHYRNREIPEATIATYAPAAVREELAGRMKSVTTAVIDAIQTLDF